MDLDGRAESSLSSRLGTATVVVFTIEKISRKQNSFRDFMHFLDGHKRSRPSATTLMSPNLPWRVMSRSVWPTVGCEKPRRYFDLFEFLTLISTYQKCPVPRGPCAAKKSPRKCLVLLLMR